MIPPSACIFLSQRHFGALATINKDGTPHLTTMWYLLEEYNGFDTIVMNTKKGRVKDRNIRRDPRVSLLVENEYHSVTISGTVEIIDDPEIAQADIYRLALRYDGMEKALQQMEKTFEKEERITLRLRPDRVYEYCGEDC